MIQRLGYLACPSLPSNVCMSRNLISTVQILEFTGGRSEMTCSFSYDASRVYPQCQTECKQSTGSMEVADEVAHLSQPGVLCNRPLRHLESSCCSKEQSWQCARGKCEEDPSQTLHGVIWTCDVLEEEAMGDDITLLPRWSQICQDHMTPALASGELSGCIKSTPRQDVSQMLVHSKASPIH